MLRQFVYPADVERDETGYLLVTFPDFPEAGTDGETLEEALAEAADCLADCNRGRCGFYGLTSAVLVTAALLRFLLKLKGPVWAAARDGER